MSFFRYIFSFLYTRNWHTGKMELSAPRLYIMLAVIVLVAVGTVMIAYLQTPVVYIAE